MANPDALVKDFDQQPHHHKVHKFEYDITFMTGSCSVLSTALLEICHLESSLKGR